MIRRREFTAKARRRRDYLAVNSKFSVNPAKAGFHLPLF